MWKKILLAATAMMGLAAPALADEPCETQQQTQYQQPYQQPYVQPYVQPTFVQPVAYRNDTWRLREVRRREALRRREAMRERARYGRRW